MENKYFKQALASMTASVAYIDAVRHLYDKGYSVSEIKRNLSYPASEEQIEKAIDDYKNELANGENQYEFVQKTDEYGRKSFVRVKKI